MLETQELDHEKRIWEMERKCKAEIQEFKREHYGRIERLEFQEIDYESQIKAMREEMEAMKRNHASALDRMEKLKTVLLGK